MFPQSPGDAVYELVATQVRLTEWAAVHRLLHEILAALVPFTASLSAVREQRQPGLEERGLLAWSWRPCQTKINALVEFCEHIEHIARRYERDGRELRGPRFAVDVVAAQLAIEDALQDPKLFVEPILELVDEFQNGCHLHLLVADREMQKLIEHLRQLPTTSGGAV